MQQGYLAQRQALILVKTQQHMRKSTTLRNKYRTAFRCPFSVASFLIELAA
jgi:hypothetical protein